MKTAISALLMLSLFYDCGSFGAEPSPTDIVAKMKLERDAILNLVVESDWEEYWDGKITSWEHQTWHWDNLARRRVQFAHGKFDETGTKVLPESLKDANAVLETEILFDGEIVVYRQFLPNLDRDGEVLAGQPPGSGYRRAIVSDAAAPAREELVSHRNPIDYLRNIVISELDKCLDDQKEIRVHSTDVPHIIQLEYASVPSAGKSPVTRTVVSVDKNRGWSPIKLTGFTESNQISNEISLELAPDGNLWAPVSGSHKNWWDRPSDTAPVYDWRFKVARFRINDPKFDEKTFTVRLEPDTAVSDTRYKVAYRVGASQALAADLMKMSQQAATDQKEAPAAPTRSIRMYVVAINVVLFIGLFILFATQHRKKGKTALLFAAMLFVPTLAQAEGLPENPYSVDIDKCCGPHCLLFLDGYLSGQCRYDEVMKEAAPGAMGTSLEQLQNAARKLGFSTAAFKGANVSQLQRLRYPAVVHIRGNSKDGHFVVVLGTDPKTGSLRGYSPPYEYGLIPVDLIASRMTGVGLLVSKSPLPAFDQFVEPENLLMTWLESPIVLCLLVTIALFYLIPKRFVTKALALPAVPKEAALILVFGLTSCSGNGFSVNTGPSNNTGNGYNRDLGEIQEGVVVEEEFRLLNTSNQPFTILDVEKSCSCQSVTVDRGKAILPGSFGLVGIKFQTKGVEGPVRQSIVVRTDSKDPDFQTVPMAVQCKVDGGLKVIPSQVMLGRVESDTSVDRRIQIKFTKPYLSNHVDSVKAVGNHFLSVVRQEHTPGLDTYKVVLDPHMPPGPIYGHVLVHFDTADLNDVIVPVVGTKLGTINIIPKIVTIDSKERFPQTKVLRLVGLDQKQFRISHVESPEGLTVHGHQYVLTSSQDLEINVERSMDSTVLFLVVHFDQGDQKELRIPVQFNS